MTDFLKITKSIAFHFAHICAYGVETVNVHMLGFKNKIEMRKRRQNNNRPINLPQRNNILHILHVHHLTQTLYQGIYNFQ